MPLIVIDRDIPYLSGVLEPYCDVVYLGGGDFTRERAEGADALIVRTRTRCDAGLLAGSKVRLIASATVGLDHVDLDYCARSGIKVSGAAGCNARAVLHWVAAALVCAVGGRVGRVSAEPYGPCSGKRARGAGNYPLTLGIVGVGHVGGLVAEYARLWGFEVLLCDPPRARVEGGDFVSLEAIAERSDIVTLHVPLTRGGWDATRHLAGDGFFEKLRPDAVLLNSSRGEVIDTRALMRWGGLFCADVWEGEPSPDAGVIRAAMLATPHIAGYSAQGKANASAAAVRAVAAVFGLPLEHWYPDEVVAVEPRPINWDELRGSITEHFDISALSRALKSAPSSFESLRNDYPYRNDYF